jgi:MazG-like nucleotide pyrophosphohydrolase family protein
MTDQFPDAGFGADLTLDHYQDLAARTDLDPDSDDPMIPLLGLAGEVGSLIAEYKKRVRRGGEFYIGFDNVMPVELGDILWYLATLARRSGHRLSDVAHLNLTKTRDRYVTTDGTLAYSFDDGFPADQRLPRRFTATFTTHVEDGITRCRLRIDDETLGALIDDNARHEDDYRFHDIFHIAHAAVLGWSPVLRSLVRVKRGLDKDTDRIEDGARAIATEEAVTAMIFQLADVWNYFEGERVDDSVLRAAKDVTARLEVGAQPAAEWEQAILKGYSVWRQLRANGGGRVLVDLDARTVEYVGID